MLTATSELAQVCRRTAEASQLSVAWFDDNKDRLRQEHPLLLREFRKFGKEAARLQAAVERPMCVGVFGPSQAGKSYLISALARRGTRPLIADFDGIPDGLDFVRQINPEGGAESTGLVTRFSVRKVATPANFPVPVRLLSQADIIKILGNTYFSDCDLSEEIVPDAEAIRKVVSEALAMAGSAPQPGLAEDDVWDIQEYFERQFKGEQIVRALMSGGYWQYVAELAPRLPIAARGRLLALLWGGIEVFTDLYVRLTEALEALGHASSAFCPIEALVARAGSGFERRGDSVIDVQTLHGLAGATGETLQVQGSSGRTTSLGRAILTGLIAELHVTMREQPWDFFEHTDLLDFPGARSREHVPDVRNYLKKDSALEGLFLRGKVAYLFERYNAEQELTSMLLCIAPSNQEVRTLPAMVKGWIDLTHGATSAARQETETALFLVLTKFDAEFEEAAGKSDDSSARWSRRMHTSLLDFFGKAHDWPRDWTPGKPFDNSFWMRNPNFKAKHIIDYDEAGSEVSMRASEAKRISRARDEYAQNPEIRRHFRDPVRAWDEAFRLNDGGITYLAESIAPVCNPHIKNKQIASRIGRLRRTMCERLQRWFVSADLEGEAKRREEGALQIIDQLIDCAANQRFGRLMRALQPSDTELADVFFNLETRHDPDRPPTHGRGIDVGKLSGRFRKGAAARANGAAVSSGGDKADRFARAAVQHWVESIRSVAGNPQMCKYFFVSETVLSQLVDELVAGAARCDLNGQLANEMRKMLNSQLLPKQATVKPAILASDVVSSFVMWLGYDGVAPADRPSLHDNPQIRIFQPRPSMDFPALGEQPSSFDQDFYSDWFDGLLAFVGENAGSVQGQTINTVENDRLGAILRSLGAEEQRPAAS